MSWLNPQSPKTGTGDATPKKRSYRAVKPSVTMRTAQGQEIPKPPKKDRAKSAGAVVSFFKGGRRGGRGQ